jgi:hypothetical protein
VHFYIYHNLTNNTYELRGGGFPKMSSTSMDYEIQSSKLSQRKQVIEDVPAVLSGLEDVEELPTGVNWYKKTIEN